MSDDRRNLVFISHANPEDNAFTLWLSTRLKLIGYQVWSDVTQLFGGEKWWRDIEQAIDQFTVKFILVITKTSLSKPGVRREVELALSAEQKLSLGNFIIPVIIDDSEFVGQPYDLSERNIIYFTSGWGPALGKLTERLSRDCTPTGLLATDLGKKLEELNTPRLQLTKQHEWVVSNWISASLMPKHLNFYRVPIDNVMWRTQFSGVPFPWFEWSGILVSFADSGAFKSHLPLHALVVNSPKLDLDAVLSNSPRNHPGFLKAEVIKKVNYLIAEAWGLKMRAMGLKKYELSSGKVAWFFPDHENFNGFKRFADVDGVSKKKKVIGFSTKNNVFWHYAVEVKAQYGSRPKICLIPHVVFTGDGETPLSDKAKMHRLRRGFCANWWNDRWRDLLLVYLNILTGESEFLKIPVGFDQVILFTSRPEMFNSEYSLVGTTTDESFNSADEEIDIYVDIDAAEPAESVE
ncbi:MAG: toll/interleukin-1 receptor domain-containing protein [Pseudohongiella sp.]|nr:toll/interleukin-1 receptor domain-containing protein [Pseudohongiella sp.]